MKKTLLLITLAIIGSIGSWFVLQQNQTSNTFDNDPHTQFAVNSTEVSRVFLADRNGNQALVEKKDGYWLYTNKVTGQQFRATPGGIHVLLETLRRIRVRYKVGKSAEKNAVLALASKGTKVEIYDSENKLMKVYNVGPMTDGAMGNFVNIDGSNDIYVGYIPKSPGTIDTRFITTEVDWRDKAIFRTNPKSIEFVSLEYHDPSQKMFSFEIKNNNGDFEVNGIPKNENSATGPLNTDNVEAYLDDLDACFYEQVIDNSYLRDSIISSPPFATFKYKTKQQNQDQVVQFYPLYNPTANRGDGEVGHRQKIQRYFVHIDKDNFFIAQHLVVRKLFWSLSYFFDQDAINLMEDEATLKNRFEDNKVMNE
jgi:hypothetical protein